ncbi:hypothetical protein EIP91_010280 [Steccherinum ochraceum]|uniref:WW domain-containing protein n=1 Tax=Steccherinum ochraceum TaxID=92696 RepID=A0A4R0RQX6_9APHY|nr:hypothetical protein EIP91_010280 [Steccherinum ochraceum]
MTSGSVSPQPEASTSQVAGSSASHGIQEIPLAGDRRSRRLPPPVDDDGGLPPSVPNISRPKHRWFQQRISEDLFSPAETLTSADATQSSFLGPLSPPLMSMPAAPSPASFRNNSAVSLPMIAMPVPETTSKNHFGTTYPAEKEEHSVRTRLPHLIVMDPPAPSRAPLHGLPDHWRLCVRLDGSLYYHNPFERLVTTEDMHNARFRTIVEQTARKLGKIVEANSLELPPDWELCVEIEMEEGEEVLRYNYISHEEGQYFQLGRRELVCADRSLYWDHVEKYCMHLSELPPFAEADFLCEMAYGATERILDNKGTTFRFTGAQTQALIGTYRELKEAQHEGITIIPALVWLFSRTMKLVEETRTNSKYGTPEAAAARNSSWKDPTWKFRIIDMILSLMFSGTHNMYRRRLMKTKFNNVLYLPDFRELLSDLIIEWGDSNLLSTVFVAVNVSFLAINDLSVMQRTCSLVSSLFAMISIAGGMHHIWNHRIKLDVEVAEASQYMNHSLIFGDRGSITTLACFLALPIASLLWSFYAFTAALTAFCVQRIDVNHPVLTFMLFVSCLSGLTTVSFFWNIWVGWKFSKTAEYVEGELRSGKSAKKQGRLATLGAFFGLRERGRRGDSGA